MSNADISDDIAIVVKFGELCSQLFETTDECVDV